MSKIEAEQDNLKDSAKEIWGRISSQLKEDPALFGLKKIMLNVSHKSNPKLMNDPLSPLLHKTIWVRKLDGKQFTFKHFRLPKQLTSISKKIVTLVGTELIKL